MHLGKQEMDQVLHPRGRPGGSSWFQPGPALAVVAILGANQQMEDFSLFLPLYLSNKENKSFKKKAK